MPREFHSRCSRPGLILLGVAFAVTCMVQGCSSTGEPVPPPAGGSEDLVVMAGAKAWADNCIRCHNIRTPASLSDRQWRIVVHHMRVRCMLTPQEHESILRFLQAAN